MNQADKDAIQKAADSIERFYNESYGFIPCGKSFKQLMESLK